MLTSMDSPVDENYVMWTVRRQPKYTLAFGKQSNNVVISLKDIDNKVFTKFGKSALCH